MSLGERVGFARRSGCSGSRRQSRARRDLRRSPCRCASRRRSPVPSCWLPPCLRMALPAAGTSIRRSVHALGANVAKRALPRAKTPLNRIRSPTGDIGCENALHKAGLGAAWQCLLTILLRSATSFFSLIARPAISQFAVGSQATIARRHSELRGARIVFLPAGRGVLSESTDGSRGLRSKRMTNQISSLRGPRLAFGLIALLGAMPAYAADVDRRRAARARRSRSRR